jgi:hypothetical protein
VPGSTDLNHAGACGSTGKPKSRVVKRLQCFQDHTKATCKIRVVEVE